MRDMIAIYNFHEENISIETLARHFECSEARIKEIIETRPWLHPKPASYDFGQDVPGRVWWESDHSDPLELVKQFYPDYLPYFRRSSHESTTARERCQSMTWQEYYETVDWEEAYKCYGDDCEEKVLAQVQEMAARDGIELVWAD